jgi:hypothetical protein
MNCNTRIFGFLVLTLAALGGCSSQPAAKDSKKAAPPDRILGKAQILEESGATDAALNAGGPSVYIWVGLHRYRLYLRKPADVVQGSEYVVEGFNAQKAIDEIGDPDQGKNGYPLQASCESVVRKAWGALAFDEFDADVSLLRAVIKRHPARQVFLVNSIRLATAEESAASEEKKDAAAEAKIPEVPVAWEKERASLIEGSIALIAPLWAPEGATVHCKVIIDPKGKVSALETGVQLCEAVEWSQFRYQPPLQGGHPVKVETDVEVRFDPRK